MRKRSYSMQEFTNEWMTSDLQQLMAEQSARFTRRFGLTFAKKVAVTIVFDCAYDANDFYNEIRFNSAYRALYTVCFEASRENALVVNGQETVFDYFGSNEPNLLTISRDLGLNFKIDFVQDYTGVTFKGEVMNGELLARQCIVEVCEALPELVLGGLKQIAHDYHEFDTLLTRVYSVKASAIL